MSLLFLRVVRLLEFVNLGCVITIFNTWVKYHKEDFVISV